MAKSHLVLFFSKGTSLKTWDHIGMFSREVALYRRLVHSGIRVSFVTYGTADEARYAKRIPEIHVCYNKWNLPAPLYELGIPWLHMSVLATCSAIKTNQADGAKPALASARLWRKPLIARCGYHWSSFLQYQMANPFKIKTARQLEALLFHAAKEIVVTTRSMAQLINATHRQVAAPTVIPNYVDTDVFKPETRVMRYDVIFIGRLAPQKNIIQLMEAVQGLDVHMAIIGSGELEKDLKQRFGDLKGKLEMLGNISHEKLPEYLNASRIFVLPSLYEGHPKTLIEAMACGRPVLGTQVPGIQQVIDHGRTGWLCRTDAKSLRDSIRYLLEEQDLANQLGQRAREYAVQNFSLKTISKTEESLIRQMVTA